MDSVERSIGCCYEAADKDWKIMAERRIAELALRKYHSLARILSVFSNGEA
jgi:hypothetical protein